MPFGKYIDTQKSAIAILFAGERDPKKIATYTWNMFEDLREKCLHAIDLVRLDAYFWLQIEHMCENRTTKQYCDDLYHGVMRVLRPVPNEYRLLFATY